MKGRRPDEIQFSEGFMETIQGPGNSSIEIKPSTLLLVDDEENILAALRRLLRKDGYHLLCAGSGQAGLDILATEKVDVIISDQRMPNMVGTVFLGKARELSPHSVRIILSGYTDLDSVTAAINDGAVYKFLTKPWDDEILRLSIKEALSHKWVQDENRMLQAMLVEVNEELAHANQQLAERADFTQDALQNLQEIVHDLPVALLGIDDSGLLVFANRAALGLLPGPLTLCKPAAPMLPAPIAALLDAPSPERITVALQDQTYVVQRQTLSHRRQGQLIAIYPGPHT
ncbi:response regulator [Uliginosibacterium sp. 31-16]|uniref:response regulator n=1 Tax=Uliginosibacterium sp. 31-16 TaxID=3068315 RepID=UPI00273E35BC|nr:response regulator [Uliginosibacterium sp. 31-16]MDP5240401.1 response regulator [Uliginosibacterium sp. 31-16]